MPALHDAKGFRTVSGIGNRPFSDNQDTGTMENRINSIFGTRYPIISGGMVWCSGWRLASAVSNAGGLGLIGAGSMKPELLREHIRKCRAATDRPFGVNVPLISKYSRELMETVLEEHVPAVFTSAGNPRTWTSTLKGEGIKVAHVTASTRFALKSQEAGVDAVVAEGFEAGGHNGKEETTTMVLIPKIRKEIEIPLIAAGGIATGAGMLAAFALGAEGVQIGTRFALTAESSADEGFKKTCTGLQEGDTVLALKKLVPTRLVRNRFCREIESAEDRGATPEELSAMLGTGRAMKGMFEGDLEEGELEIGQISCLTDDIPSAAEVIRNIVEEYDTILGRLQPFHEPPDVPYLDSLRNHAV